MDAETHLLHIVELLNWRADQLEGSLSELKRDLNASGADSEVVSTISKSRKHVEVLRMDIEKELEPEAEMSLKMAHHITNKIIQDAVDRLADKVRSQYPQLELAATMLRLFFEGPEGDIKRKELETRLKAEMGLDNFGYNDDKLEFEEIVEEYEKEAEQLALSFAMEDAKKMVDACFGVQAEK
ncbi:hypothetical protein D6C91_02111 [Aureobasidium pullulans]|uniref:Uncharacterized protein n=1 Tax=Aureobasidium pullulans TaxID=5580 RepID=A0A4S9TRK4_AURPU|nr:hypothetical protein D6C91_02111 [Aureobasidium pullulans]TIA47917.1 hypothetical protein D6C79_04370 [Aureobasidium pullulans]TIA79039.1 hypothetical protein D6C76_03760 [Aureobasidium pullulans]